MANYYAAVTALIFAIVALIHIVRLTNGWSVQVGSRSIPMSVSWVGRGISAVLAIGGLNDFFAARWREIGG
jgi:alpha-D-ribose 1-methylphosphonate 5-phosphate C-P lyase